MSEIKVRFVLLDNTLEAEQLQETTEFLLQEIKQDIEIEDAGLVPIEKSKQDGKSVKGGGFALGELTITVAQKHFPQLLRFLSDRLSGKMIELEVEAKGKRLKIKATNQAELLMAMKTAQDFIKD